MKKFKHMLEAVNKGIKLAIDDFDFNNEILSKSTNDIIDQRTDEIEDKLTKTVDMGLPSGTRWCIYNIGVDPNNLNVYTDWYGDYYAWGETEIKSNYTSDNYFFDLHKYHIRNFNKGSNRYKEMWRKAYDDVNIYDRYSKVGYIEMYLKDDVAYASQKKMMGKGFKYCIPTREQFRELVRNCSSKNVYDYQGIKDLNGKLFISKINGNQLFFPFIGYKASKIYSDKDNGFYWTSTLSMNKFWYAEIFKITNVKDKNEKISLEDNVAYNGIGIRPVLLHENKRPKFKVEVGSNKIKYYDNGFE